MFQSLIGIYGCFNPNFASPVGAFLSSDVSIPNRDLWVFQQGKHSPRCPKNSPTFQSLIGIYGCFNVSSRRISTSPHSFQSLIGIYGCFNLSVICQKYSYDGGRFQSLIGIYGCFNNHLFIGEVSMGWFQSLIGIYGCFNTQNS